MEQQNDRMCNNCYYWEVAQKDIDGICLYVTLPDAKARIIHGGRCFITSFIYCCSEHKYPDEIDNIASCGNGIRSVS